MGRIIRETKQRAAIRQVLTEAEGPLTPKAIRDRAAKAISTLGIATVYRTLSALLEDGQVETIELPGMPTHYCLPRKRRRPLLVCEESEKVIELPSHAVKLSQMNIPKDFEVNYYEFIIYGNYAKGPKKQNRPGSTLPQEP